MLALELLDNAYLQIFRRPRFKRFNERVHMLALRSLGVLNWETPAVSGETAFLSRIVKICGAEKDFTAFDVGAHNGEYARMLFDALPCARIYSFEPNPVSFRELSRHASSIPGLQPVNAAVGDVEGTATLYDYVGSQGTEHASLVRGVIENIHGGTAQPCPVTQLALDSFLSVNGIRSVDLLKIDVEGNELNVLRGCPKALREGLFEIVQFEFNEMNISSRVFFQDFIELLDGYKLFRLLPQGMIPLSSNRYQHYRHEVFAFQNIVAIYASSRYDCREMTGNY